jgi:hypothetical protein
LQDFSKEKKAIEETFGGLWMGGVKQGVPQRNLTPRQKVAIGDFNNKG